MSFDASTEAELTGWDSRAELYGATTARATTQAIPALLAAARVAAGNRLVDVGCGPGYAAGAALGARRSALGAETVGFDAAPAMVTAAPRAHPGCRFEIADATALPGADGSFDAAPCSFGLFHLADPAAALLEMRRVLIGRGRVAVSQWCAPAASAFFKVVFGGLGAHADMSVVLAGPPPFALSAPDALEACLAQARFEDVTVSEVPVVFEAPADAFPDYFRDFSVRGSMILERQGSEAWARIEAAWRDGFAPFVREGAIGAPMPALIGSGRKP
ncbi:MAG: class I SAM-dependent methyltransferase [Pseudomonadota bacterium]